MIHMSMSAFYATVNQMFRVQIRPVLIGHTKGIQIGPEAIFLGNPDINRYYGGLALTGLSPTRWLSLTVHAGYMNSESVKSGTITEGVYAGASGTVTFGGERLPLRRETEDEPP